ncbi:MAG: hypothetical protein KAG97_03390, partial [Victivallales bacterium]|nr:hypothetical protein [Victivallales bacterium]
MELAVILQERALSSKISVFLEKHKIPFEILNLESVKNTTDLFKYRFIITSFASRNTPRCFKKRIAEYASNGGTVWLLYGVNSTLTGCRFASSEGWGGWSKYRCVSGELSSKPPGVWMKSSSSALKAFTYGLCGLAANAEPILEVEIARRSKKNSQLETSAFVWLVKHKYGKGFIFTGGYGIFPYLSGNSDENLEKTVLKLIHRMLPPRENVFKSAILYMDVNDAQPNDIYPKDVYLNDQKIGQIPPFSRYPHWSNDLFITIPADKLIALSTINEIVVVNVKKDPFKIRNLRL